MSTINSEAQRNQEMSTPAVEIEIKREVDCMFEEESSCNGYKNSYKAIEPTNQPEYVNYYDSKSSLLEQVKKEIPDKEYLQSNYNISSKLVFEDTNLLTCVNRQKEHIVNKEEELTINSREENLVTIKIEKLEEQDISDNAKHDDIRYDALVTLQEVDCKFCGRKFKNSFNLIKHNTEHIAVVINRTDINEINKLHQCHDCDEHFGNFEDMLSHVSDVHCKKQVKSELCKEQFNSVSNIDEELLEKSPNQVNGGSVKCISRKVDCKGDNILNKHTESCHTDIVKEKYKCTLCERFYISKHTLRIHTRNMHFNYGRMFDCWCGEQFLTLMHLSEHKRLQHGSDRKTNRYKCKYCEVVCREESKLNRHMKKVHRDYGRVSEYWCGKQSRIRTQSREQKYWHVPDKSTYDVEANFIVTRARNN